MIHLLDAEHRRSAARRNQRVRHDVLLIGKPRHKLARNPDDDGRLVRKLDAVRFVDPGTGEADDGSTSRPQTDHTTESTGEAL